MGIFDEACVVLYPHVHSTSVKHKELYGFDFHGVTSSITCLFGDPGKHVILLSSTKARNTGLLVPKAYGN